MGRTFTRDEMVEYLKQAVELETTAYRLQQEKETAEESVWYKAPRKTKVEKPTMADLPPQPKKPEKNNGSIGSSIGWLVFGVVFIVVSMVFFGSGSVLIGIFEFILGLFAALLGADAVIKTLSNKRKYPAAVAQHESDMKEWEASVRTIKDDYDRRTRIYNQRIREERERYDKAEKLALDNYNAGLAAVEEFDEPIQATKNLLERLYSMDVIFPKYRNLIAMCTIYEYFATGRVDSLEGPHGAYNLYEQELRQNIIIGQLDTIITKLDEIKQNQYTLYQAVQKVNDSLDYMSKSLNRIVQNTDSIAYDTKEIAKSAGITASCAQAIASNTEALKYIELVTA